MTERPTDIKVTFLGTSTAIPDLGSDTASFVINGRYLVDTGWNVVNNLRSNQIDPMQLEYIFFTHLHQDHYVSLPALLFYLMMKGKDLKALKIIGPSEDVERVVKLSMSLLQNGKQFLDRDLPTVIPLTAGDGYEDDLFRIDTCSTKHPVQGLCYRFTNKVSGKFFSFTGDTAFHPPIIEHVKNSAFLIHDTSFGPDSPLPENNVALHSGAPDAAKIAESANVGKLFLVHGELSRAEQSVEVARTIFSGEVEWPKDGQSVLI